MMKYNIYYIIYNILYFICILEYIIYIIYYIYIFYMSFRTRTYEEKYINHCSISFRPLNHG